MVAARSRMKQADSAAHSCAFSGGDSRVFDWPAAGVRQKIAIAIDLIIPCLAAPVVTLGSDPTSLNQTRRVSFIEHGLLGKPVSTFPDHALAHRLWRLNRRPELPVRRRSEAPRTQTIVVPAAGFASRHPAKVLAFAASSQLRRPPCASPLPREVSAPKPSPGPTRS